MVKPCRAILAALTVICVGLAQPAAANPKYAGIVIDANTGKTLYAQNADEPRYPASLTKMMTLYMLFEAIDSGRVTKQSRIPFSAHAASRPPSKLGVGAGNSITVENAILALVTKSANDVAAATGEFLGGTESKFAAMMTAKARQLGMTSTTFRNASGLPDDRQVTTARDMAKLGIALREHFPHHYHYFSTRSFQFGKRSFANHNRLLGRVRGVDGIKTGYIRAAGFNLVTSATDGNRRIVAVVMGGRTGKSRNDHMADLVARYLPKASPRKGGALIAQHKELPKMALAALAPTDVPVPEPRPMDLITGSTRVAAAAPLVDEGSAPDQDDAAAVPAVPSGWVIQVASVPSRNDATRLIEETLNNAGPVLAGATGFTEVFEKDGVVYHRVRFGGFDSKTHARNTCAALKKKKIGCYAVAN